MGRLGQIASSIPLVPTKRSLGKRLVSKELAKLQGGADFVGLVRDHDGWHVVPSNYETDGDREWGVPVDGSERYPADGIGGDWGSLYGVPIVVGYRNFGAARQLPNTRVARDVVVHRDGEEDVVDVGGSVEETSEVPPEPEPESAVERLRETVSTVATALPSRGAAPVTEPGERRPSRRLALGLKWILGDADALDLVQDSDGQWALERVDYELDDQMYNSRDSDSPYDAEGAGCAPKTLAGVPIGFSNGRFPMMLPPIRCRLGRNLVEERLAGERSVKVDDETGEAYYEREVDSYGGAVMDGNGRAVVTDGGVPESLPEGAPEPKEVTPGYNDVELEERAFVNPDDIKQLGDPESTQEKIEALVERAIASQNTPGGELKEKALQYGGYFLALLLGWWFGTQTGGGGGGGEGSSASSASPLMADVGSRLGDVGVQAQTLVLDAGTGVI